MNLGVVGNPRYEGLPGILRLVAEAAGARGLALYSERRLGPLWPVPPRGFLDDAPALDALVTFGGDGTLLRGARMLTAATPILGVNFGRVGFLTTASGDQLLPALDALASGEFRTEDRLALEALLRLPGGEVGSRQLAVNDVVLHKRGVARVIRLNVFLDGDNVGPYSADGIIVASPTGSTAYSLSAGGPILLPGVHGMLVTPICAHTLAVRPLVVPDSCTIVLEPLPDWSEDLLVSFDGQTALALAQGSRIEVRCAAEPVRLIRIGGDASFVSTMRRKLHWGDLSHRSRPDHA